MSSRSILTLAALLASSLAFGHHSMAMFDSARPLTLGGTIREFQWGSPHCYIQLLVSSGTPPAQAPQAAQEWSLEMGAPMYLYRLGWRPSTLKAGDKVTVKVYPLRDGTHGGLVLRATTADGRELGNSAGGTP